MNELLITAIHVLEIRNVALVTGVMLSGLLTSGDKLRSKDGTQIRVLGIEFPTPATKEGSVTIVVPADVVSFLRIGETLRSP